MSAPSRLQVAALAGLLLAPLGWVVAGPAEAVSVPLSPCVNPDHGNPVIDTVELSAPLIDVRRHARAVTVRARIHDTGGPGAATGVVQANATAATDHGLGAIRAALHSVGGDLWVGRLLVPRHARPGRYIVGVGAFDAATGQAFGRATVVVRSIRDTRAPRVTRFQLSRSVIDSTSRRRGFTVTVDLRDTGSSVRTATVDFTARQRARFGTTGPVRLRRIAGTPAVGRWRGRVVLAEWAPGGLWDPVLQVDDLAGNQLIHSRFSSSGMTSARGARPRPIRVRSGTDSQAPVMDRLTVSGTSLDLRPGPADVAFSLHVREARSRVGKVEIRLEFGGFPDAFVEMRLVSGSRRDGIWRGTWTALPCQVRPGTWTVRTEARDVAGNIGAAPGVPPTIEVTNDDHQAPTATGEITTTALTLRYQEDVVGISPESATVERDPFPKTRIPALPFTGRWTCQQANGLDVDCAAGPLRVAVFVPDTPFLNGSYSVRFNPEHVLAATDLFGNPLINASATLPVPAG